MTKFDVRPLTGGHGAVRGLLSAAFGFEWPAGRRDPFHRLFEPERSLAAYDGDDLIGHVGLLSLPVRVPGGEIDAGGITLCGVSPTHRRGGILRRLMSDQFTRLHDTGAEPLLLGSPIDPAIYWRYGCGQAGHQVSVEVMRGTVLRPVPGMDDVTIRYQDPELTREQCADLRDAVTVDRPGTFRFTAAWRKQVEIDPALMVDDGFSRVKCVFAERDGATTGFAYYRTQPGDDRDGTVDVRRVHATDAASYAALWRFLTQQDLMACTRHAGLAPDDPLLTLLGDSATVTVRHTDALWARLIDADRALAARTYASPVDVVLDITDEGCPWNTRRWRLSGDPDGAVCEATTAPADLTMDMRELSGAYLGGRSLLTLAAAGLVHENTPGALAATARAMLHPVLPWRDTTF